MTAQLDLMLTDFDHTLPLERARTIPAAWYRDPIMYEAERRAVFGNTWQAVGRTDQIKEPGRFLTAELAGEPILVVRDGTGVLRAFYNICRHRAARVATEAEGNATRFRCRYHGWTYDLAGRLKGTPEFEGVTDFCKEDQGLMPLSVATWGPFVWVHGGHNPPSLEVYLAPLPQQSSAYELKKLKFVQRNEYRLACNWKVFVDNYLDGGYHINTIHPGLAGVLDYSQYKTTMLGNTSLQTGPIRPADTIQGDGRIENVRQGNAYYWWIFPNLMLNIYDGVMDSNLVLPMGPDACRVVFDFYFATAERPDAEKWISESIAVTDQIQVEDMDICEDVQRGLSSRFYDTGRFCVRREGAGYYFHQLLARQLGAKP